METWKTNHQPPAESQCHQLLTQRPDHASDTLWSQSCSSVCSIWEQKDCSDQNWNQCVPAGHMRMVLESYWTIKARQWGWVKMCWRRNFMDFWSTLDLEAPIAGSDMGLLHCTAACKADKLQVLHKPLPLLLTLWSLGADHSVAPQKPISNGSLSGL